MWAPLWLHPALILSLIWCPWGQFGLRFPRLGGSWGSIWAPWGGPRGAIWGSSGRVLEELRFFLRKSWILGSHLASFFNQISVIFVFCFSPIFLSDLCRRRASFWEFVFWMFGGHVGIGWHFLVNAPPHRSIANSGQIKGRAPGEVSKKHSRREATCD